MERVLLAGVALLALGLGSALAGDGKEAKSSAGRRRPSDVVYILIEMSDVDTESAQELQHLYDVLRKLDKNHDGKIDLGELKVVREQLVDERLERIFKKLDSNGDGKISKDEAQGRIREHFDQLDKNGDGFIARDELREAMLARQASSKKE